MTLRTPQFALPLNQWLGRMAVVATLAAAPGCDKESGPTPTEHTAKAETKVESEKEDEDENESEQDQDEPDQDEQDDDEPEAAKQEAGDEDQEEEAPQRDLGGTSPDGTAPVLGGNAGEIDPDDDGRSELLAAGVRSAAATLREFDLPELAKESLAKKLIDQVGAGRESVAIIPGDAGVIAVSSRGTRRRVIAPGKPRYAWVDGRANVVWIGQGADDLAVLDLEKSDPRPQVVAKGLPELDFGVRYSEPNELVGFDNGPVLALGAKVAFVLDEEDCAGKAGCPKITQLGTAVLANLATRSAGRRAGARLRQTAVPGKVANAGDCEGCGTAQRIPFSQFQIVRAQTCVGDKCRVGAHLFDPTTQRFFNPQTKKPSETPSKTFQVGGAWFCIGGDAMVIDGKMIRLTGGMFTEAEGPRKGGGCLGGQFLVADPGSEVGTQSKGSAANDAGRKSSTGKKSPSSSSTREASDPVKKGKKKKGKKKKGKKKKGKKKKGKAQ